MTRAILFFAHGAREPSWRANFDVIVEEFARAHPDMPVAIAFLEFMKPDLLEAVEALVGRGATEIVVCTLFLAAGGHTLRDMRGLIDEALRRWPELKIHATEALTESPEIRRAIVDWACTHK